MTRRDPVFAGQVFVYRRVLCVTSGDAILHLGKDHFAGQSNGLCGAATPGLIDVTTATHTGDVNIVVELHEAPPPLLEDAEDVVEASLQARPPGVSLFSDGGSHVLNMPDDASYRVRCSAWNLDVARDNHKGGDRYLLQFWPAEEVTADEVVKVTSAFAQRLHEQQTSGEVKVLPPQVATRPC